jgi:hypothetical protein
MRAALAASALESLPTLRPGCRRLAVDQRPLDDRRGLHHLNLLISSMVGYLTRLDAIPRPAYSSQ